MHYLRRCPAFVRFALAWFVLSLGVATASPWVHPQAMQVVCSASGAAQLVPLDAGGMHELRSHTMDCPLCVHGGKALAPPPLSAWVRLPSIGLQATPKLAAAPLAARTMAALPARGPPTRT